MTGDTYSRRNRPGMAAADSRCPIHNSASNTPCSATATILTLAAAAVLLLWPSCIASAAICKAQAQATTKE